MLSRPEAAAIAASTRPRASNTAKISLCRTPRRFFRYSNMMRSSSSALLMKSAVMSELLLGTAPRAISGRRACKCR